MNRTLVLIASALFITSSSFLSAQEDDGNLIKNGSFEETTSTKYKKLGQFSLVSDWTVATEEKVDLFSKLSEYPEIGVPNNALGRSNPKEGDNYAGLLLYNVASKDGRMYIGSELKQMLKKGQKYCLSYSISLADASKFATNNLGFVFSKKPEFEAKDVLIRDNAIYPLRNLATGRHTLQVKGWDVANNAAEGYTEFVVAEDGKAALDHVLNYPNPFTTNTYFQFEHNMAGQVLDVQVNIFSVSGRLVKTIQQTVTNNDGFRVANDIQWDGRDEYGDSLARGVYLYRVKIRGTDASGVSSTAQSDFEKLVILK